MGRLTELGLDHPGDRAYFTSEYFGPAAIWSVPLRGLKPSAKEESPGAHRVLSQLAPLRLPTGRSTPSSPLPLRSPGRPKRRRYADRPPGRSPGGAVCSNNDMSGVFPSLIAVLGTLLGSIVTYSFQRRTAQRAERFARHERLRQERMSAYSGFAEAAMEYRHEELTRWLHGHGELIEPFQERVWSEQGRLRARALQARYRVQLLADDPRLVQLADAIIDAAADIHNAKNPTELRERGTRTRQGIDEFIQAASADIR